MRQHSMWQRVADKLHPGRPRRFRRSSARSAVQALVREEPGHDEPAVPNTEATPGEAAVGQEAANRLSALVEKTRELRARLGTELVLAHHGLRRAVLKARSFAHRPEVEETRELARVARAEAGQVKSFLRVLVLPRWLFWMVVVTIFTVEVGWFFSLFTALSDISPDRRFTTIDGWVALGASTITPLIQVLIADLGGGAIARGRAETRLRLEELAGQPAAQVQVQVMRGTRGERISIVLGRWLWPVMALLATAGSSVFFFFVSFTRFGGEAARDGAVSAPVGLLALIFAALPWMALTAGAFRRDLLAEFRSRAIARGERVETTLLEHKGLVDARIRDSKEAWLRLARVVAQIVDEANLAIALWAQLIMEASMTSGGLGKTAPLAAAVERSVPRQPAIPPEDAWISVPKLDQQNPIKKPFPPWVLDSLRLDVELLERLLPSATLGDSDDVIALITRFAANASEQPDPGEPVEAPAEAAPGHGVPGLNGKVTAGQVL